MTFATYQEWEEALDNYAAEYPLDALREGFAEDLSEFRLDACAIVEPLAALIYAAELLTPERRAICTATVEQDGSIARYVPDRHAPERLIALRQILNSRPLKLPELAPVEIAPTRRQAGPKTVKAWIIACAICGTEFRARRADARFCSARCRQKASRARAGTSPAAETPEAATMVGSYL
jgi:hypothetical protein